MTQTINIRGAAGGVGTSTVAAALAVRLAENGLDVELRDNTGTGDVFSHLGLSIPMTGAPVMVRRFPNGAELTARLRMTLEVDTTADVVVADWGVANPTVDPTVVGTWVTVTTSRYSAVRRAMALLPDIGVVVVRTQDGDALRMDDVQVAVGRGVRTVEMPTDVAVARALDAGLLLSRRPPSINSAMVRLEEALTEAVEVAR